MAHRSRTAWPSSPRSRFNTVPGAGHAKMAARLSEILAGPTLKCPALCQACVSFAAPDVNLVVFSLPLIALRPVEGKNKGFTLVSSDSEIHKIDAQLRGTCVRISGVPPPIRRRVEPERFIGLNAERFPGSHLPYLPDVFPQVSPGSWPLPEITLGNNRDDVEDPPVAGATQWL